MIRDKYHRQIFGGKFTTQHKVHGYSGHIEFWFSFSLVDHRLQSKSQLFNMPASALEVCVVVGGVESEFSDQIWP
jgi:hypothetical protein